MKTLNCMHISDIHEENVFNIVFNSLSHQKKDISIDILFITGDLTYLGKLHSLKKIREQLDTLFKLQLINSVVIIPGNHDLIFQRNTGYECRRKALEVFEHPNIHIQIHGPLELKGLKMFCSAWTPEFGKWAFNYDYNQAKTIWDMIPDDIDILVTHGPPYKILDYVTSHGTNTGCPVLLDKVKRLAQNKLKYHLFGHIHDGYGASEEFGVKFFNSSIMDERYNPSNKPQYFSIQI